MNSLITVEIEKMVYGGRGIGRPEGKVVFVPFTAPGDRVRAEITHDKKRFAEALLRSVENPSPLRVDPFCKHFGECGGCHYQHISYPEQLKFKEAIVRESLHRAAGDGECGFLPVVPSPRDRGYRIRAQFKGGPRGKTRAMGFYAWGSHRLVNVTECPLLHPRVNEIYRALQERCGEYRIEAANIQVSPEEDQGVVTLVTKGGGDPEKAERLGRDIPGVKGVMWRGKRSLSWGDIGLCYEWPGIPGKSGLKIRAEGDSFSQVNPFQNRNLRQRVVEWANLTGKERVLDLYCGSGNLSLPLAQAAEKVWGIDNDARAVACAEGNAAGNGLSNCRFISADTKSGLSQVGKEAGSVDVTVLDPPRAGAKDIGEVTVLRPKKILYVSCDPPTMARDLAIFKSLGYDLIRVQALDMFPHTYHVEVIAELAGRGALGVGKTRNEGLLRGGPRRGDEAIACHSQRDCFPRLAAGSQGRS